MFDEGNSFVFYDAEHVMSVIAKSLVHLLREGEGRGGKRGKGKNASKCNIFGIFGTSRLTTALYNTFVDSSFLRATLPSLSVSILHRLNLTILLKN